MGPDGVMRKSYNYIYFFISFVLHVQELRTTPKRIILATDGLVPAKYVYVNELKYYVTQK